MSNHGVDIEIAEMTSIVSSDYSRDDREDLKTTKKSRLEREMSNHGVFQWLRETRERSDHLSELQRSVHKRAVYKQLEDFVCFREALRRMIVR